MIYKSYKIYKGRVAAGRAAACMVADRGGSGVAHATMSSRLHTAQCKEGGAWAADPE